MIAGRLFPIGAFSMNNHMHRILANMRPLQDVVFIAVLHGGGGVGGGIYV